MFRGEFKTVGDKFHYFGILIFWHLWCRVEKMKNKLEMEDLKDIVIMMMMQKNGLFGWRFVERISKCTISILHSLSAWNDDKLQEFVKLVLNDENYDDIGRGRDCGLFEIFPHLENHVTIREVLEKEKSILK